MTISTVEGIIATKSPDFVGDSRIADFDEMAQLYATSVAFKTKWVYARALIVLHMLTLDAQGGGSSTSSGSGVVGGIKSEKEGDLSRAFNSSANTQAPRDGDAYWNSTSFGSEYLLLRRACFILPRTKMVG